MITREELIEKMDDAICLALTKPNPNEIETGELAEAALDAMLSSLPDVNHPDGIYSSMYYKQLIGMKK